MKRAILAIVFCLIHQAKTQNVLRCTSTYQSSLRLPYCNGESSLGEMDEMCSLEEITGLRDNYFTLDKATSKFCVTAVVRIKNIDPKDTFQETFVYRGPLEPSMYGVNMQCKAYCDMLGDIQWWMESELRIKYTIAYVGCWNEGANIENLDDIIRNKKDTKFDCRTNSSYANENPDADKPPNAPSPSPPPGLPPTAPPLVVKEVSPPALAVPGHWFAAFAVQALGLVLALILLVTGIVFYIGFKSDLSNGAYPN